MAQNGAWERLVVLVATEEAREAKAVPGPSRGQNDALGGMVTHGSYSHPPRCVAQGQWDSHCVAVPHGSEGRPGRSYVGEAADGSGRARHSRAWAWPCVGVVALVTEPTPHIASSKGGAER